MQCTICRHGETQSGKTTVMLERDATIIVYKDVPAEVCAICSEAYVDKETTGKLLHILEEAVQLGVPFSVRLHTVSEVELSVLKGETL